MNAHVSAVAVWVLSGEQFLNLIMRMQCMGLAYSVEWRCGVVLCNSWEL